MSTASVGRTTCVCHKQAAVGQNYYISKRKKTTLPKLVKYSYENRIVAVVAISVYMYVYFNGNNLAWQKRLVLFEAIHFFEV